jgi:hypothetical protein
MVTLICFKTLINVYVTTTNNKNKSKRCNVISVLRQNHLKTPTTDMKESENCVTPNTLNKKTITKLHNHKKFAYFNHF